MSKLTKVNTYTDTSNYWAPLADNKEEDENKIEETITIQRRIRNLLERLFGKQQRSMVVDLGTTSHFVRPSDNFPNTGPSHKSVSLPNGAIIKATNMAQLPFAGLTNKAREAHVLPELKAHLLISVPKLADEGYVTLFLDGQKGVAIQSQ